MTTTDLAAALLRDVPTRYQPVNGDRLLHESDVLAAIRDLEARVEKNTKGHEKEVYVWSENYAALKRKLAEATAECGRRDKDRAELHEKLRETKATVTTLTAQVEAMRGALKNIDALDPEKHIDGCSVNVLRGLVLRMGEIARAALPARGVGVNPLVWLAKSEWHHVAENPFGECWIKHYNGRGGLWTLYGPGHYGPNNNFPTLEAAKAAAQADYEARIFAALAPTE